MTTRKFSQPKTKDVEVDEARLMFKDLPPVAISSEGVTREAQITVASEQLRLWTNTRWMFEHQMASERHLIECGLAKSDNYDKLKKDHAAAMAQMEYWLGVLDSIEPEET